MPRSVPPLTWFRAFDASARRLSFTAAAEELHLTQPAISQQVKALESHFNVSLFHRKPRGLSLTDEGRKLLPEVSRALGMLADISRGYDMSKSGEHLTVAASVSFIQWVLAPGIHRFLAHDPGLKVRLISTVWLDDFRSGGADVEIRFGSEALLGRDARRLLPDDLVVVASPGLSVDAERLEGFPLIEAVGVTDGWDEWVRQAGYPRKLEPSLHVDYHGAALDLAVSGAGIALTSSLLASGCLEDGSLARVRDEALTTNDGYFLSFSAPKSRTCQRFEAWLWGELSGNTGA